MKAGAWARRGAALRAHARLASCHTALRRTPLTSYSCLKPYPSAVFIWLMCCSRSATLTAGWSWPVWNGELRLRQWRWGDPPPSRLLDSLTELRCSSGETDKTWASEGGGTREGERGPEEGGGMGGGASYCGRRSRGRPGRRGRAGPAAASSAPPGCSRWSSASGSSPAGRTWTPC